MAKLTDLPAELISHIGGYFEPGDFFLFRSINKKLQAKLFYNFIAFFRTVKISFVSTSLMALDIVTQSPTIAQKVEHLIIGTESIRQYHRPSA
jgi:hypothetical protein